MSAKELLDEAMKLKLEERFTLVEGLIKSLDAPDKKRDEIWAEESESDARHIWKKGSKSAADRPREAS